jgi:hypothetical protein
VYLNCFEQQQRQEEVALVTGNEADQPGLRDRLPSGEGQCTDLNLGVALLVVGMGVVTVVFVDPPAVAQADG